MLTVARPSTLPCGAFRAFRARAPTSLGAVRPTQLALSRLQHRPRHAITQRTRTQPRGVAPTNNALGSTSSTSPFRKASGLAWSVLTSIGHILDAIVWSLLSLLVMPVSGRKR